MQLSFPQPQPLGSPRPQQAPAPAPESGVDLRSIIGIFTSRLPLIIACVAIFVGAAVVYLMRTPKMYASYAVLEAKLDNPALLSAEGSSPNERDTLEAMHTFEQNLTNRSVLVRVARELNLDQDIRLLPKNEKNPSAEPTDSDIAKAMMPLAKSEVRRGTRLIDLTVKYFDAETAQKIADKIIELYVVQGADLDSSASKKTREYLQKEVERLQAKLEKSDAALQQFKEDHRNIPVEDGQNLSADRLKELNAQLTASKGNTLKLEAEVSKLEALQSSDPSLLLTVPGIASLAEIVELQKLLSTKQVEFSVLKQRYMHKHPRYIQADREVQDLQNALNSALITAVERTKAGLANAKESEAKLQKAMAQQEQSVLEISKMSTPYLQLRNEVNTDRELLESVSKRLKELSVISAVTPIGFVVAEAPIVEPYVVSPGKTKILALGMIAGLMLGAGGAFALEILNPSMKKTAPASAAVVEAPAPELPVLAELQGGFEVSLIQAIQSNASKDQGFLNLRRALQMIRPDREARSVAVTSIEHGAGKSYCAMNLAASYAEQGLRTLLIETDFRNPSLADALLEGRGLPSMGLTEGLSHNLAPTAYCHHTIVPNLHLIPAGQAAPHAESLLSQSAFQNLLLLAWSSFDRIVIDTAPVRQLDNAMSAVRYAEAVCLVVREESASRKELEPVLEKLNQAGRAPVGLVVNTAIKSPSPAFRPGTGLNLPTQAPAADKHQANGSLLGKLLASA